MKITSSLYQRLEKLYSRFAPSHCQNEYPLSCRYDKHYTPNHCWAWYRMLAIRVAYSFPDRNIFEKLVKWGKKYGGYVEIGAGRGVLAECLRQEGVDIIAYDNFSWQFKPLFPVNKGSYGSIKKHSDRILLLSWPHFENKLATKCITAYNKAGGIRVAYLGEGYGGACAEETFFDLLEKHKFREVWWKHNDYSVCHLHDDIRLYRRY